MFGIRGQVANNISSYPPTHTQACLFAIVGERNKDLMKIFHPTSAASERLGALLFARTRAETL